MQNAPSTRAPRFERYDQSEGCAVERALEVIGGKWKGVILFHLLNGTMRFGQIRQAIGKVTQRTLTRQLRELEADGIITRTVHNIQPPRVDYALTDKGAALGPMLYALQEWGRDQLGAAAQRD